MTQEELIAKLQEVLAFYADEYNYRAGSAKTADNQCISKLEQDKWGAKAREALNAK